MSRTALRRGAGALLLAVMLPALATAQTGIVNARIETRSAAAGLAREIDAVARRGTPAWIGYRVPILSRPRATFADSGRSNQCRLEPASDLLVLARFDGGRLAQVRSAGVDCDLDAGGMPVVWFTDATADDSVAWLRTVIADTSNARRLADAAVVALALHDTMSAARALVALARDDARAHIRGTALFWVAQRAADDAAGVIGTAIDSDPDLEVKKKAVFALSQLPKDESVPKLIELARSNRTREVRRQAMFWLGQSNDPRAVAFFEAILLK